MPQIVLITQAIHQQDKQTNSRNTGTKTSITLCLTAGLLGWAAAASADVLELKNGKVLTGKYVGGTAGTIRFETASGAQVIETAQATALTFTAGAATAVTPASVPATARQRQCRTLNPPPSPFDQNHFNLNTTL